MSTGTKLRNIGPKSAAWLRQTGVRTLDDLKAVGALAAYVRVKRAGFKPSLNLLYSLEGALDDCHWQQLGTERREQLLADLAVQEEALGMTGKPKWGGPARPVTTIDGEAYQDGQAQDHDDDVTPDLRFD